MDAVASPLRASYSPFSPCYNLDHIGTVGVSQTGQEESQIKTNPWTPGLAVPLGEPREALPHVLQDPEDISPGAVCGHEDGDPCLAGWILRCTGNDHQTPCIGLKERA